MIFPLRASDETYPLTYKQHSIKLTRRKQSRRISLKVSARNGIEITAPVKSKLGDLQKFIDSRSDWLEKVLQSMPPHHNIEVGDCIPISGVNHQIVHSGYFGNTYHDDGKIFAYAKPDLIPANIEKYFKILAKSEILKYADKYTAILGKSYSRINIRDTHSRWGSCSASGNLSFSWRLIMAPSNVLEYVVAHEVAHLKEMNHSKAFWSLVAEMMPDYKPAYKWIKTNGKTLHSYVF